MILPLGYHMISVSILTVATLATVEFIVVVELIMANT